MDSILIQWLIVALIALGTIFYLIVNRICQCITDCKEAKALATLAEKAKVYEIDKNQADKLNKIFDEEE